MAGQTITVSVLADTKKFSSAMGKLGQETGLSRLASGAKTVGRFVGGAVAATAGLGVAVAGLAIKGGFQRALNIEDAQASLKGLGHDTKSIQTIMDSALASVRGTSFGLGDAATIAATAVAAGIKPGEELTRKLTLTSNAAALARTSLGDMGSILNKVWTSGRVGTEELNQLADRGIPIWTKLADQYGVTQEELRKMVSSGKVDAETFAGVLEGTVGNAAGEMGKTVRGSWNNMFAALSRVGEKLISGVFPKLAGGIQGVIGFIDNVAPVAEKVGAAIGTWINDKALPALARFGTWFTSEGIPALRAFAGWFAAEVLPRLQQLATFVQTQVLPRLVALGQWITGTLVPALVSFGQWIVRNREWLSALAVTLGTAIAVWMTIQKVIAIVNAAKVALAAAKVAVIAFNAALAANPIGLIITAVVALVAGLVYFFTQTETGRVIWAKAWAGIQAAAKAVASWFTGTLVPNLQRAWTSITNAASAVGSFFTRLWNGIKSSAEFVWRVIAEVIRIYINAIRNTIEGIAAIPGKVAAWFGRAREGAANALNGLVSFVRGIPGAIMAGLSSLGSMLVGVGRAMIDGLRNGIASAARGLSDAVLAPVRSAVNGVKSFLGIRSPSRLFRGIGEDVSDGLTIGLQQLAGVRGAMRTMSATVSDGFDPTLTLNANGRPGAGGGNTYHVTVQALAPSPEIGRLVVAAIRDYERQNGGRR